MCELTGKTRFYNRASITLISAAIYNQSRYVMCNELSTQGLVLRSQSSMLVPSKPTLPTGRIIILL